ncbi:MAG: ABC transporter ATP-binding protein [Chloroflexota bacterium]|nr:ABC transporter ATP-binding protein [Chloroflexota bacterium]
MAEPTIEIEDLRVIYGGRAVVDRLSLTVRAGETFGLLGPNGAGKSTTLACVQGLRRPSGGSVRVAGHDIGREAAAAKRLLGVQLQQTALFPTLRLSETVALYAALYARFPDRPRILALLDRFGLGSKADARPGQLSGGQQQRLALALALVNDPPIVLLDEPTTGLDPQARRGVWATIEGLRADGRTVVLTTHAMEEAQALCDRVGIMDAGRLVAIGAPADLIRRFAPPLPPVEARRRTPNLEDVFLALTGRRLEPQDQEDERRAA